MRNLDGALPQPDTRAIIGTESGQDSRGKRPRPSGLGLIVLVVGLGLLAGLGTCLWRQGPWHDPPAPNDPYLRLGKPTYLPPVVTLDVLRPVVDRRLKESVRLQALQNLPVTAEPTWKDLAALYHVLDDVHDSDTIRHEVAMLLRNRHDPALADALRKILTDPEEHERFRFFATQHLGELFAAARLCNEVQAKVLRDDLRRLLADDRHAQVRRQALLSLGGDKDAMALATMTSVLEAAEDGPLVETAMRLVVLHRQEPLYPQLRRRAYAEDPFIRRRAMACLGELRDEASRTAFERAAADQDQELAEAGRQALQRLAGTTPSPSPIIKEKP
jgi:HEAT repeat protein